MNVEQERVMKETRLRNLKRKYAKLMQHAELKEEAIEVKAEMDGLERDLQYLQ